MTPHDYLRALAITLAALATTDDLVPDESFVRYASGFQNYTAKLKVPCEKKTCEATATLIADRWALTALHVVGDAESCTLTVGDKTWKVDRIVRHPDKADVALLRSEESFGLDFYPPLSDGEEAEGDICSIAGYGVHGRMSEGHNQYDGRLRAGTNHVERFERDLIVCTASPGRSKYEVCIAPGDSGGPLFCKGKLCGINSITMAPKGPLKSRTGEESGHVRVSLYKAWIEETIK
jgi:hypothetical protein